MEKSVIITIVIVIALILAAVVLVLGQTKEGVTMFDLNSAGKIIQIEE